MTQSRSKRVAQVDTQTLCLIQRVELRLIMILPFHIVDSQPDVTCKKKTKYIKYIVM